MSSFHKSFYKAINKDALSSIDHSIIFSVKMVNFILALITFSHLLYVFVFEIPLDNPNLVTLALALFGLISTGLFDMVHRLSRAQQNVYTRIKLVSFGFYGLLFGLPLSSLYVIYTWLTNNSIALQIALDLVYVIWAFALIGSGYILDSKLTEYMENVLKRLLRDDVLHFREIISDIILHRIFRYRNFALAIALSLSISLLFVAILFPFGLFLLALMVIAVWFSTARDRETIRFRMTTINGTTDIMSYILCIVECLTRVGVKEYKVHYKQKVLTGYGFIFSTTIYPVNFEELNIVHLTDISPSIEKIKQKLSEDWELAKVQPNGPYRCPFSSIESRSLADLSVFDNDELLWHTHNRIAISFSSDELRNTGVIIGDFFD